MSTPIKQPSHPSLHLTVRQVEQVTGIGVPTLYQWIQHGEFPGVKVAGRVLVWRSRLVAWLVERGACADEAEAERLIASRARPEPPKRRRQKLNLAAAYGGQR